jgi:phage-related protein (TIGR01555 family)
VNRHKPKPKTPKPNINPPPQKPVEKSKKVSNLDSFQNQLARLGAGTTNLMNSTEYPITRLTRNYQLMNSLYRNSWIIKKVINVIPEDMCKNWFSLSSELKPGMQDRYDKLEKRTQVKEKILEGLYWGRLYGGAGALILIEGHEDILQEPLVVDDILPNSFKGLLVADRWSGIYPSLDLIKDINDPDFGLPEYYEYRDIHGRIVEKVHHTRIIRFTGRKLPFFESQMEIQWGASEVEHVFPELEKRDNTSWNIASLVFQANLLVNKVDGMDQLMSLSDPQAQADFYNVKQAQNQMRNNNAMMICGKEEEITSLQYSFSGLNDIYESFMLDVAGACDVPVTKLFGRSPQGMNATGDSDMQMYYDMVAQQQNTVLRPKIDKLLPIMFMSEFGEIPDDLDHAYNPIKTPSDEEAAELVAKKVDSVDKVYNSGIINQKMALMELHELSYTTNMFSCITDEDIAAAKTDFIDETDLGGDVNAVEGLESEPPR